MPKAKVQILALSEPERAALTSMVQARSLPAAVVLRARIVLSCEGTEQVHAVATALGVHRTTVTKWLGRFLEHGTSGLYDEVRQGRPRTVDDEREAKLVTTALGIKPPSEARDWSTRLLAIQTGIAKSTVDRYLQPYKPGPAAEGVESLPDRNSGDVVGLYLSPPDNALVLRADHKEPNRRQVGPTLIRSAIEGYPQNATSRHPNPVATALVAALAPLKGQDISDHCVHNRTEGFLAFLRAIDRANFAGSELHVLTGNWFSHKQPKVRAWVARRSCWHVHALPTYMDWRRNVEDFMFTALSRARPTGSHSRARALTRKMDRFVQSYNESAIPFAWITTTG